MTYPDPPRLSPLAREKYETAMRRIDTGVCPECGGAIDPETAQCAGKCWDLARTEEVNG